MPAVAVDTDPFAAAPKSAVPVDHDPFAPEPAPAAPATAPAATGYGAGKRAKYAADAAQVATDQAARQAQHRSARAGDPAPIRKTLNVIDDALGNPDTVPTADQLKEPFVAWGHRVAENYRTKTAEGPTLNPVEMVRRQGRDVANTIDQIFGLPLAAVDAAQSAFTRPAAQMLRLPKATVDMAVSAAMPEKGPRFGFKGPTAEKPNLNGGPAEPPAAPAAATPPPAPPKGPGAASPAARARAASKAKTATTIEVNGFPLNEQAVADVLAKKPGPKRSSRTAIEVDGKPVAAATSGGTAAAPVEAARVLEPAGAEANGPTMSAGGKGGGTPPPRPSASGPGPILDPPVKGETTEKFGTRADDALHRLTTNHEADKIEMLARIKALPPEAKTPAVQEQVYHDIERRMVNPKAPITPGTEAGHAAVAGLRAEEAQLFKDIKAKGYGEFASGPEVGDGYVHRVVKGKGQPIDTAITGQSGNPVASGGGRSLSKDASSLHARKYLVLEGPDGVRNWVPDPKGMVVGQPVLGPDLKFHTPKHATTSEIEHFTAMGGQPVTYVKNALANTTDNVVRLRAVKRNIELLEALKAQAQKKGLIHFEQTKGLPPEHYVQLTMPQFKGAYADPKLAHVLNDFHGQLARGGVGMQVMAKINKALTNAMFITPIPHAWNVANHWAVSRGWAWVKPTGYRSLMVDGTRAIKDVLTNGPISQQLLREGASLIAPGVENEAFHRLLLHKLGVEIMDAPKQWGPIARMFGFPNVVALVNMVYRASSLVLWKINDMFMVQRILELQRKGLSIRQAIAGAEKDIPSYRAPSYVGPEAMGDTSRRALAVLLKSPNATMFGRYRYGQFKAYAEMGKEMFAKGATKAERTEGAGKLFIMAALAMGAYPIMDRLLRMVSGNPNAEVHRGGGLTPIKAAVDVATGDKSWGAAAASVLEPAPFITAGTEMLNNKDGLGRNIIEPASSLPSKIVQGAEYVGSKLGPVSNVLNIVRGKGVKGSAAAALAPLAAIKLPTEKSVRGKEKGRGYDQKRAARRQQRDTLERIVHGMLK